MERRNENSRRNEKSWNKKPMTVEGKYDHFFLLTQLTLKNEDINLMKFCILLG